MRRRVVIGLSLLVPTLVAAPVNGITPPFTDQRVEGFSGILRNADGTFDVLSDNGYGSKANSADFVLRIHRIAPDRRTLYALLEGTVTGRPQDGPSATQ